MAEAERVVMMAMRLRTGQQIQAAAVAVGKAALMVAQAGQA
jgi:hypothetical protein